MPVTSPYWLLNTVVKNNANSPMNTAAAGNHRFPFHEVPTAADTMMNGTTAGSVASSVSRPATEFGL